MSGTPRRTARDRNDRAGEGLVVASPSPPQTGQGKFCIWSPKKNPVSDAYFGPRLLEYDFLLIARGQEDYIKV